MKIKSTIAALLSLLTISACAGGNGKQPAPKQKEKNMETIHLTKAEVLKRVCDFEANPQQWKYVGTVPCVVDFYATWCGPCKMISPLMEELAKEYEGKIVIYKVDVDQEQDIAAAFGVRSIPTLLWCPMTGNPTVTHGAMMKGDLKKMIDQTLLK